MDRLKAFLATLGTVALTVVASLGMAAGSIWLSMQQGYLQPPALPPAEPPPAVEPEPVRLRLYGPSLVVRGDQAYFHCALSGPAGYPQWTVRPSPSREKILDDGRTLEFVALDPGVYTISVAVAGDRRQIATDQIAVEIVDFLDEEPPPEEYEDGRAEAPPPEPEEHIPTVAELVQGALEGVESLDRAAEARVVAGSIKSIIGQIETGLMPPDADPLDALEQQVATALGPAKSEAWFYFLSSLRIIAASLRDQGQITTAATFAPMLREAAAVLSRQ